MKLKTWLLDGDSAITRLVMCHLLEQTLPYEEVGAVLKYLKEYKATSGLWDEGLYGPYWTSTFYTLRALTFYEISPQHDVFKRGLSRIMDDEWRSLDVTTPRPDYDVCVLAMLASLFIYSQQDDPRLKEILELFESMQMSDGGWNCECNHPDHASIRSSFHTTLSVLEALNAMSHFYPSEIKRIKSMSEKGQNYLLQRRLLYRFSDSKLVDATFLGAHFPVRWHYDYLRALEYFVSCQYPYDQRLAPALDLLEDNMSPSGKLALAPAFEGKVFFEEDGERANTYRALKVLKFYRPEFYEKMLK